VVELCDGLEAGEEEIEMSMPTPEFASSCMTDGVGAGPAGAGVGVDDGAGFEDALSYESPDDSIVTVLFLLV